MIKIISTLVILLAAVQAASAQVLYSYNGAFTVQGIKAYLSSSTYDANFNETITIEQYDFPSLNYLRSLTISPASTDYYAYSSVDVEDNGLLVTQNKYDYSSVDNVDGSTTVTYTTTYTTTTYGTDLIKQGEKVTEDTYSYDYYPYYYGGYDCSSSTIAKEINTKVLAKKKGGGKKGGTTSCSKLKMLNHKVIK